MYDWVIFDVDGTLIDTEKAILYSLKQALKEEINQEYSVEDLVFVFGIPGTESLQRLGIKNINRMKEKWNHNMKNFAHYIKVFTDIEFVLKELAKAGIKTGIVTSRTKQELDYDFSPFQLLKYFPYVVCADDTIKHKPEPEPIFKFAEIAGIEVQQAIYIGDTIYDQQAAQGAGMDFGLALWGAKSKENIHFQYQFKSPREIISVVKRQSENSFGSSSLIPRRQRSL